MPRRLALETTGNPIFVVPGSMLGAPGVSLPVLNDDGLPLGLQVLGFPQDDAGVFAVAGWIEDALRVQALERPTGIAALSGEPRHLGK